MKLPCHECKKVLRFVWIQALDKWMCPTVGCLVKFSADAAKDLHGKQGLEAEIFKGLGTADCLEIGTFATHLIKDGRCQRCPYVVLEAEPS